MSAPELETASGSPLRRRSGDGGGSGEPEAQGSAGLGETVWNVMNLVVGGGVLSMPYVLKLAGWAGVVVVVLFAALFGYTAVAVGMALSAKLEDFEAEGVPRSSRDFSLLARMSLGPVGQRVTEAVLILENWSAAVCYMLFVGENVKLISGASVYVGVVISGVLTLFMIYVPLRWLAYVGMVGMLFAGFSVCMLVVQGVSLDTSPDQIAFDVGGIGIAGGIVLFCFAGHACLPNLYWSMRRPKEQYAKVCYISYGGICLFYVVSAAAGYFFFGDSLTDQFTAALSNKTLQLLAISAILVKIQAAVPPALLAPVLVIENVIGLKSDLQRLVGRCIITVLSIAVAVFCSDQLTLCVALSGYLTTSYDSLIFPAFVALRLGAPRSQRCILATICFLGVVVAAVGTWASVTGADSNETSTTTGRPVL